MLNELKPIGSSEDDPDEAEKQIFENNMDFTPSYNILSSRIHLLDDPPRRKREKTTEGSNSFGMSQMNWATLSARETDPTCINAQLTWVINS